MTQSASDGAGSSLRPEDIVADAVGQGLAALEKGDPGVTARILAALPEGFFEEHQTKGSIDSVASTIVELLGD